MLSNKYTKCTYSPSDRLKYRSASASTSFRQSAQVQVQQWPLRRSPGISSLPFGFNRFARSDTPGTVSAFVPLSAFGLTADSDDGALVGNAESATELGCLSAGDAGRNWLDWLQEVWPGSKLPGRLTPFAIAVDLIVRNPFLAHAKNFTRRSTVSTRNGTRILCSLTRHLPPLLHP
jgi:hypothetical protein